MEGLQNLEQLNKQIISPVSHYAENLIKIHKRNILSIAIYGSAVGEDFIFGVSDINMAVILDKLGFEDLKKSLLIVSRGLKYKISAPLFLTKDYVIASTDVFPIEFFQIKENNIVIFGEDIFGPLRIDGENLRLFCEQQIKGKLVRVRQAYLEIGLRQAGIKHILKDSLKQRCEIIIINNNNNNNLINKYYLTPFELTLLNNESKETHILLFPVFRNILRLKNIEPPLTNNDIVEQLCKEFGLDKNLFDIISKDKRKDFIGIKLIDLQVYLEKFLMQLERLSLIVDNL